MKTTLGARVRTYRERLEMTVADLAARSGLDAALVNAIEKDEVVPALGVLTKLSRALGQRLGTFMDDQYKPDPIVTRAADGCDASEIRSLGYASRSLADGKPDRHMDPFCITFAPGGGADASSHEGEELIICLEGEVELSYGNETHLLKPGDTAYYNSVVKHALRAIGGKGARIYGIVFMPA
jgi:transcriptional regulator with XRE-family HTH domain